VAAQVFEEGGLPTTEYHLHVRSIRMEILT
jgi:hypothetical protein